MCFCMMLGGPPGCFCKTALGAGPMTFLLEYITNCDTLTLGVVSKK